MDFPYLYRAVTNRCLTFLRDEIEPRATARAQRLATLAPRGAHARATTASSGSTCCAKLVRELDDAETEVLTYRYFDDMTQDEIATLLGLSRKTVGKRLDRVREAVRRTSVESEAGGTP